MITYILKSGESYVKSTRYSITPELFELKAKAEASNNEMELESFKKAIEYQLEEQVFTGDWKEALQFDSVLELKEFFDRNMSKELSDAYIWDIQIIYKKG